MMGKSERKKKRKIQSREKKAEEMTLTYYKLKPPLSFWEMKKREKKKEI